jgi:hypothetical protein
MVDINIESGKKYHPKRDLTDLIPAVCGLSRLARSCGYASGVMSFGHKAHVHDSGPNGEKYVKIDFDTVLYDPKIHGNLVGWFEEGQELPSNDQSIS